MVHRKTTTTRGRRKGKPRGMMGRPPTGLRPGERLIDYKQVTVRLPPETVAQLEDLAEKLGRPQWRVMCDALAVLSRLPAGGPSTVEGWADLPTAIARGTAHPPEPPDRADEEKAAEAQTVFVIAAWHALLPGSRRELFLRGTETELTWAIRWQVNAPCMVDYARSLRVEYANADDETRQKLRDDRLWSHYRIGVPPPPEWLAELERLDRLPDWRQSLSDKVGPTIDEYRRDKDNLEDDTDLLARPGLNPDIETDEHYMERAADHCRARRLRFQRFVTTRRPPKPSPKLNQHVQWLVRRVVGGETITAIARADQVTRQAVQFGLREARRLVQLKSRPATSSPPPRKI